MAEVIHKQTTLDKLGLSVKPDVAAINTMNLHIWQISGDRKDTFLAFGERQTRGPARFRRRLLMADETAQIIGSNPAIREMPGIEKGEVHYGGAILLDICKRNRGLKLAEMLPLERGGEKNYQRGASTAIWPYLFQDRFLSDKTDVVQRMENAP